MIHEVDIVRELEASHAWRAGLILNERTGKPRALLANALHALRHCPAWRGVLKYNSFALVVEASATPWGHRGKWNDQQDVLLAEWFQHEGVEVSPEVAGQAVQTVAREASYHPVQQWLRSLEWDCNPRLGTWLSRYMGVPRSAYSDEVGKCALIGAVARAMQPGSKVDSMLILEGRQGIGKSQACAILGGKWFSDELADLGTKDAALQLASVWLLELSELDSMSRAEASRTKAFLSRQVDHFRPPYGRAVIDQPRSCWFIGSTNGDSYLRDETGARRFWPVRCGRIDLEALRKDRDQLFAEARVLFEAGAGWWLQDVEVISDAIDEQAERYDSDPWQEVVAKWLVANSDEPVTVERILTAAIRKSQENWTQQDKSRVCRCMRAAGWTYTRRRIHGSRVYLFLPPTGTEDTE